MTRVLLIDPVALAQERLERHMKAHPSHLVGQDDDLQIAEVAALIAIAMALRHMIPGPIHVPESKILPEGPLPGNGIPTA